MTDNEIVKTLPETIKDTLNLIEQQQAEIDRLNSLCTSQDVIINSQEAKIQKLKDINNQCLKVKFNEEQIEEIKKCCFDSIEYNIKEIKSEAIKEFADRLFRKSQHLASSVYDIPERGVFMKDIDDLVKEMTKKGD